MTSLAGRRAVVTGASRNLGAETALRLAHAGVAVAVNFRSSHEEAAAVVACLPSVRHASHLAVGGDVGDPTDAKRVVGESSLALGGPIDILINNAGPYDATPFMDLEPDAFDRAWDANVKATYLMCSAVAPGMQDGGWGRIVNISAVSAFVRNRSIYSLANAAIITLTEQLAVELGPAISVNAVAPGQISESLEQLKEYSPDWAEHVVAATPTHRLATRREIADIIVSLCSPLFDSVTGITIPIDGGLRLNTF